MNLILTRTERTSDGTFGQMIVPQARAASALFCTMEDDWLDNRKRVSCIPAGTYPLRRTMFYRHGYECFEVANVPNRSRILIHIANTEEDVEGCIGLGLRFGPLWVHDEDDVAHRLVEKRAALASGEAFRQFMSMMAPVDTATLEIHWADGLP